MSSPSPTTSTTTTTKTTTTISKPQPTTTMKVPPSFYQRILPSSTCVGFASPKGKKIFQSALHNHGLKSFYNLIQQYHTQTEPAYCGVSTLVMVLNALAVDPQQNWKGPWRWYEERMLNCCLDMEQIKSTGITLRDFQCLALCQGLSVDLEYVYDDDDDHDDENNNNNNLSSTTSSSLKNFRRAVLAACVESPTPTLLSMDENDEDDDESIQPSEPPSVLVVSYNRKTLQQTGSGHFSPVAAYDVVSDSVLILDTARFKYGAHWVKLSLLHEAMKSIDPDTGKPRGFALLSFLPPPQLSPATTTTVTKTTITDTSSDWMKTNTGTSHSIQSSSSHSQPVSILFRIKMNQNEKRRNYKKFLRTLMKQGDKNNDDDDDDDDNNDEAADSATDHSRNISFDKISSYFKKSKNGKHEEEDPIMVWEIVEPVRASNDVGRSIVEQMRTLLRDLKNGGSGSGVGGSDNVSSIVAEHQKHDDIDDSKSKKCCGKNEVHNGCVSPNEAVYLVYLAALPELERRKIVMDVQSDVPDTIREQLLVEADMIDSAIEMSDELTSFES
jgi:glutathione gamma-glutamylcysteinyltransferase